MTSFADIQFQIPFVETMAPASSAIAATSKGIAAGVSAISTALEVVAPFLALLDKPTIDPGAAVRNAIAEAVGDLYEGTLTAFHLYPENPWKIYTFRKFAGVVASMVGNAEGLNFPAAATVWLIEEDNAEELQTRAAGFKSLFGLPETSFEPASVTRDPFADYVDGGNSIRPIDALPGLRDLLDNLTRVSDSFGTASGFASMAQDMGAVLKRKAEHLASISDSINASIEALKAVGDVEVKRLTVEAQESAEALSTAILEADNGPGATSFVAGSVFVYDEAQAAFVEALL